MTREGPQGVKSVVRIPTQAHGNTGHFATVPWGPGPLRHQLPCPPWPITSHTFLSPHRILPVASQSLPRAGNKLRGRLCGCWQLSELLGLEEDGAGGEANPVLTTPQGLCPYLQHSAPASAHGSSWCQRRPGRTCRIWPGWGGTDQSPARLLSCLKGCGRGPTGWVPTPAPFLPGFVAWGSSFTLRVCVSQFVKRDQ